MRGLVKGLLLVTLLAHAVHGALLGETCADMWWAMATGRYIVEHGEVPLRDVFSYTYQGAPWFNQEWLSQVLFYELFHHGGGTAVAVFKLALATSLFLLAAWIAWRRSGSLVFAVGASSAAAFVCEPYLDIRSQLFSFVGTLVLMAILDAYRRGARVGTLALLPTTLALWVNLHFSFIYGLGVLLLVAGCEVVKAALRLPDAPMPMPRALRLAAAAALAGVACLLNPQGVQALISPFDFFGPQAAWRKDIIEWLPTVLFRDEPFNPAFFGYFFVGQVLVALGALLCAARRFDVSDALHVAVTAVMALMARRFVPLFGLVSVPFAAKNLALIRQRLLPRPAGAPELHRVRGALAAAVLSVLAVGNVLHRDVPYARETYAAGLFDGMTNSWYFPRAAVEFLNRNPLPGRLYNLYGWGGYLIYWAPERKVFIDGRAATLYPSAFYRESATAEFGEAGWSEFLDRYQIALVLWPSSSIAAGRHRILLQGLRSSPSWRCVYDDGHSAVFAHVERGQAWIERYRSFALEYPDTPRARLFLADAYIAGNQFERARRLIQDVLSHLPEQSPAGGQRLLEVARSTNQPMAWFGVAFYRDVRNDLPGATAAYRIALERGLGEPHAAYAREALERLAHSAPAERGAR